MSIPATLQPLASKVDEQSGRSGPLGATVSDRSVNFSVFSRNATGIELLLFDRVEDAQPSRVIQVTNRSYHYWHASVPNLQPGQIYGYRVDGPFEPRKGLRFDSNKVLLDPYARAVAVPQNYTRDAARGENDNTASAMKSVVVDSNAYDWEGDAPLGRPSSRTIIYEMHVRGFTCHPSSGIDESLRGTYSGLTQKIPYLKQLGFTAV
jgi:isoamylase